MSINRTTVIVFGGVALAAWLSAAMNPGRAPAAPAAVRPAPIDASGAELSAEIARLRERLRPDVTPRHASRNPFVFRSSPSRAASISPASNVETVAAATAKDAAAAAAAAALAERGRLKLTLAG